MQRIKPTRLFKPTRLYRGKRLKVASRVGENSPLLPELVVVGKAQTTQPLRRGVKRKRASNVIAALLLLLAGLLSGCMGSSKSSSSTKVEAAHVEKNEETGLGHITLTEHASKRLGISTAQVVAKGNRQHVPYAAVLYDDTGGTWVYTSPEPLSFERHAITIEHIKGDVAVLTDGPSVGTEVVTVGVAQLYGTESGVGH